MQSYLFENSQEFGRVHGRVGVQDVEGMTGQLGG